MGSITRQLLVCLVVSFFFSGLHCKTLSYPDPGICEYDNDCLKEKAKCVRRECQCKGRYEYGDGKTYCEEWRKCENEVCPGNSSCLRHPTKNDITCKCKDGFFGKPEEPSCKSTALVAGRSNYPFPCLSKKNCPTFSTCFDGTCNCPYELTGDGEMCREGLEVDCHNDTDCKAEQGRCFYGICRCVGMFVGSGKYCRKATPCPENFKCENKNTHCLVDPLYPKDKKCVCNEDARPNIYRQCVDCIRDSECKNDLQLCIDQECKCIDGLAIGSDKKCKPGPLHSCQIKKDCDTRAKCVKGKCFCEEGSTGNGKYCRDSQPCQGHHKCDGNSKCVVDPLIPDMQQCVCNDGYRKTDDGMCVEITECFRKQGQDCITGETCRKVSDDSYKCQDIDECSDSGICPANSDCENSEGSYHCKCSKGYARNDNGDCEDKDECSDNLDTCGSGQICVNKEGGYSCKCKKGYIKKDGSCVKVVKDLKSGSAQVSGYLITFIFGVLGSLVLSA